MIKTKFWIENGYTLVEDASMDVFQAALERIRYMFTLSDHYVVSFSGGKDSTSVLMMSLIVARELDRLPLEVAFIDEEVIDPDTIEYATELTTWDELSFRWFCVPIRHTLRSKNRSHWYTWDPNERDVWARELPPNAITDIEGLDDNSSYVDVLQKYYHGRLGWESFVGAAGIRMEESFNRRRNIIRVGKYIIKKGREIYGKPIYDWKVTDVWRAIILNDWPHSRFYDKMWMKKISLHYQRVAPWGNVAGVSYVSYYPEFYPDFWERAIRRLPELRPAYRYGNSKLYREIMNKPVHMTWQEYTYYLLDMLDEENKAFWQKQIESIVKEWSRKSTVPFPEENIGEADDGMTWKRFAYVIGKNDRFKGNSRDLK